MRTISKSRFVVAEYCSRRLWLESNMPELRQRPSADSAIVAGNRLGELARQQRARGVLVEFPDDFDRALQETQRILALPGDLIVFEPAFSVDGAAVRCDVLERRQGEYYLTEVKSSTEVKHHHLRDLAFQTWVLAKAGLHVAGAQIQLVNRDFVYQGDGDYSGIFRAVDLTNDVNKAEGDLELILRDCQAVVQGPEPSMPRGAYCRKPWECGFQHRCSESEPEYPISLLGSGKDFLNLMASRGWRDVRDVPEEHVMGELPLRIWRATRKGCAELNGQAKHEIANLPFPRFYFDFETFSSAIPIWKDTGPYQQVPFQWSCHTELADGTLEHKEFLDTTGEFPGHRLSEAMIEALGNAGPIFVYTGFEKGVIGTLVRLCPDFRLPLERIVARLVDLHPLTKASYYHPHMKGSWSIKAVLPTVAPELSYLNLGEVRDGGGAVSAYEEIIDPATEPVRRHQLIDDLLMYCKRDTEALVALVRHLVGGSSNSSSKGLPVRGVSPPPMMDRALLTSPGDHRLRPHGNCYWVVPGMLLAGEYPGSRDDAESRRKLEAIIGAGILEFIDLTEASEPLAGYLEMLTSLDQSRGVIRHTRCAVRDVSVPTVAGMRSTLATIRAAMDANRPVYLHCWGGIGRTGTVVGCLLVEFGYSAEEALSILAQKWTVMAKRSIHPRSPETEEQVGFIRRWSPGKTR